MASSLAIGRVRIRRPPRAGDDGLRVRLGVDRLLAGLDAAPQRLPPAAILVIRSLGDPLPGRIDVRAARLSPRWRGAVAAALDDHAARAARPALGDPGVSAAAVVFADRAELLACLAGDVAAGAVGARWWWQALGLRTPDAVVRAFSDTPAALPGALRLLAEGRPPHPAAPGPAAVAAFVARLEPGTAHELALVVARAFGAEPAAAAALGRPAGRADGHGPPPGFAPAPWDELLGPPPRALAVEQQLLAGLGVSLGRSPAVVRSAAFVRAVAAWAASRAAGPAVAGSDDRARLPVAAAICAPAAHPEQSRPRPAHAGSAVAAPRADPGAAAGPAPRGATHVARPEPRGAARSGEASARRRGPAAGHPRAPAPPATPAPAPASFSGAEPLADVVATGYGGLFQLVYLAQRLGLYGDFTTPAQRGLRLDPWDFVTLVGRRLLGRPPLAADPVWALLAGLAGRPRGVAPGAGLRPPLAWRVPRGWLEPFDDDRGGWRSGQDATGRLRLVHAAGFTVVDAPRGDLARELARYGVAPTRARAGAPARAPARPRECWVAHMAAYVRARLSRALGLPPAAAARAALVRPALVAVTATHVDVTSQLADLPIEVRLAGLDRDPGFIPAAGRTLRLHFT